MNIKDFLMDNYIYIIIVIVLIIITIIGFLADKKKGDNKKMASAAGNNNPGYNPNAGGQITYQPNTMGGDIYSVPNNGPINVQMNNMAPLTNQMPQPVQNNPVGVIPQPMNEMNLNNNMIQPNIGNAPQPVEPINNIMPNGEPMYQPLAEQPNLINNLSAPQVVEPIVPNQTMPNNTIGLMNQPQQMVNNPGTVQNNVNQPINNFNQTSGQPVVAPTEQNNILGPLNNVAPVGPMQVNNQMPSPQPNPPQPVNPMPMPGPAENTIPNPITPPQPVNPTPVGFVYGVQPNNPNNNM